MYKNFGTMIKRCVLYTFICMLFLSTSAHAYVDPGSGSVIVTTVLGFIAAVGYTFRKFFYNIRAKLSGKKKPKENRSLDD